MMIILIIGIKIGKKYRNFVIKMIGKLLLALIFELYKNGINTREKLDASNINYRNIQYSFNKNKYLKKYEDIKSNPLEHFINHGIFEGRNALCI